MSAQVLLAELARLDVKVKANGGNLSHDAPKGTVTPELLARPREHKAEIIRIMREDDTLRRTGVIQSERQVSEMARARFGSHDQEKE